MRKTFERLRRRDWKHQYAFFIKNIRDLSFEQKVIFGAHAVTFLGCLMPWMSISPYAREWIYRNGFSAETWLIGLLVAVISAGVVYLFADTLLDTKKIPWVTHTARTYFWSSAASLTLLILAWSVLWVVMTQYDDAEFRFGFALCFLCQTLSLVSAWMHGQKQGEPGLWDSFQSHTT